MGLDLRSGSSPRVGLSVVSLGIEARASPRELLLVGLLDEPLFEVEDLRRLLTPSSSESSESSS